MTIVALIPARAGSKRIPGKNTKLLAGKPLIAYTIAAAQQSGIFKDMLVCSDSEEAITIAHQHHLGTVRRPPSGDDEPDIVWVQLALEAYSGKGFHVLPDAFAILRPTSPFRTAATIQRAWDEFQSQQCSSIRAVEVTNHHPAKMWQRFGDEIRPLFEEWRFPDGVPLRSRIPFHSLPTQRLPLVYRQNASLEMAWTWCVTTFDSISGPKVAPFFTEGLEGFDINEPEDFARAEQLMAQQVVCP